MVMAMATIRGVANSNAWQVHFLHFTWFQSLHLILKRKDSEDSSNKYFSLEQDHPKSLGITSLWIAAIACLIIASKYFNMIYFNIHIFHVSNISIFRTVSFFWVKLRQHVQGRLRLHEGGRRRRQRVLLQTELDVHCGVPRWWSHWRARGGAARWWYCCFSLILNCWLGSSLAYIFTN